MRSRKAPALDKKFKHDIEVVVDRVVVKEGIESRLAGSLETILELADGLAYAEDAQTGERHTYSAKFACPVSGFTIDEIEPRLFSFNNPFGACPDCDGLGVRMSIDPQLVVPDPSKRTDAGAIAPWMGTSSQIAAQSLDAVCRHYGNGFPSALARAAGRGETGNPLRHRAHADPPGDGGWHPPL